MIFGALLGLFGAWGWGGWARAVDGVIGYLAKPYTPKALTPNSANFKIRMKRNLTLRLIVGTFDLTHFSLTAKPTLYGYMSLTAKHNRIRFLGFLAKVISYPGFAVLWYELGAVMGFLVYTVWRRPVKTRPSRTPPTVGFHNFNLRIFDLRVSNPNKLIVDVFVDTMSDFDVPGSRPEKTR